MNASLSDKLNKAVLSDTQTRHSSQLILPLNEFVCLIKLHSKSRVIQYFMHRNTTQSVGGADFIWAQHGVQNLIYRRGPLVSRFPVPVNECTRRKLFSQL